MLSRFRLDWSFRTAFAWRTFSLNRFWSHKIRQLRCKRPTPHLKRTPLAAEESRYKCMRMRTWRIQNKITLMRIESITAEAAAHVSDSALDNEPIFWVLDDEYMCCSACPAMYRTRCFKTTHGLLFWLWRACFTWSHADTKKDPETNGECPRMTCRLKLPLVQLFSGVRSLDFAEIVCFATISTSGEACIAAPSALGGCG